MAMARSDSEGPDSSQETVMVSYLFKACLLGDSEEMRTYLTQDCDWNETAAQCTMLLMATEKRKYECLSVLKEAHKQGKISQDTVNFRGNEGQTALYRAMVMGNKAAAELLFSMGANLSIRANSHALPLAAAPMEDSRYDKGTAAVKAIVEWAIPIYMALDNGEALVQEAIDYLERKSLSAQATLIREERNEFQQQQQAAESSASASASLGSKF